MSFGSEIDAIAYKAMAEQCARVRVEVDTLRSQLVEAQRKMQALESAHLAANPWPVRWRYEHGISRELAQNVDGGSLGHYCASPAITDEQAAVCRLDAEIGRDSVRHHLLAKIQNMIRYGAHYNERARCTVYTGEIVVGALDPRNPNQAGRA